MNYTGLLASQYSNGLQIGLLRGNLNIDYGIKKGIVLYNGNLLVKGALEYLPIYMTMFLKNGKGTSGIS